MATSVSSIPSNLSMVTNFYNVLIEGVSAASGQITTDSKRIDSSSTTLAEVLRDLFDSADFKAGHATEVAELFFLLFGRAPDYATYLAVMNYLRAGGTFADVVKVGLSIPGQKLSDTGYVDNMAFAVAADAALNGTVPGLLPSINAALLADQLNRGVTTRVAYIAAALESGSSSFHTTQARAVQTSLVFLAAAQQEASSADLSLATGALFSDIQTAFATVGLSATSGKPYFIKPSVASSVISLQGELTGDLVFDASSSTYTLGGVAGFKSVLSVDGGWDAGLVTFSSLLASGITSFDASAATGKGKLTFTGLKGVGGYVLKAPNTGSVLQGADGSDTLIGGSGVDRLVATGGADTLTGNAGVDTFVFAKANDYVSGGAFTRIADFGNGKDVLDFSSLLGASAPTATTLTAVKATSTLATALSNGSVSLLENNGQWFLGTSPSIPTATDLVSLFGAGKPFANPTAASRHVIVTADLVNDARVWLVNNATDVTHITSDEVYLIGRIDGDWNVLLNSLVPVLR